jgi:hypothetical protein
MSVKIMTVISLSVESPVKGDRVALLVGSVTCMAQETPSLPFYLLRGISCPIILHTS